MTPKLLAFLPCERLVIGAEGDNTATIVAILQGFTVQSQDLTEVQPSGAANNEQVRPLFPLTWYVFVLWENPFDGNQYTQRFELSSPNEKLLANAEALIDFPANIQFVRWNVKLVGFPLDGVGMYTLRLKLKTGDGPFIDAATFPIPVIDPRTTS